MKTKIIMIAVTGCIILNVLAVGAWHSYLAIEDWLQPQKSTEYILDLDLDGLYKLKREVQAEIDFRTGVKGSK